MFDIYSHVSNLDETTVCVFRSSIRNTNRTRISRKHTRTYSDGERQAERERERRIINVHYLEF